MTHTKLIVDRMEDGAVTADGQKVQLEFTDAGGNKVTLEMPAAGLDIIRAKCVAMGQQAYDNQVAAGALAPMHPPQTISVEGVRSGLDLTTGTIVLEVLPKDTSGRPGTPLALALTEELARYAATLLQGRLEEVSQRRRPS